VKPNGSGLALAVPAMKWRNRLAQGFSPGCGPHEIALKVATESLDYNLIGRLKGSTSKRLKERGVFDFGWQNGYGAFSVSESNVEAVTMYIQKQAEHHLKFTFQEEVREILKRHRVNFDERYVWD
jgi:putative transposase